MTRTILVRTLCTLALATAATTVHAQYGTRPLGNPAVGEDYHVEASFVYWSPDREITVSSESLGIIGTDINAVTDLGFEKESFPDVRLVLRPSKKFKFRLGYTPIKYEAQTTLSKTIVFNGQRYDIGLPVSSRLDWKDWRFGLEYDFVYADRGYFGLITEVKYTDVEVDLTSPIAKEFSQAKAPIPTIGAAGRVYLAKNLSVTGEFTGLKLNVSGNEGTYVNFDLFGTFNFINNIGVQGGYRTLKVDYLIDQDSGNLDLKGWYFGGVVRF